MEEKTETKKEDKIESKTEKKEVKKPEPKKDIKEKPSDEREYIIPLRHKWQKVPRYKRTNKAIRTIKEFLVRHMKIYDRDLNKIKIDKYLNEMVWFRGIKSPPSKIKVKVFREGEIIRVEAAELLSKIRFKKERKERIDEAASEKKKKKKESEKPEEKPEEVKSEKEKEEETKEEEEKKSAVVESGNEQAKKAAKATKHQTKISKQPKRQMRQALKK